MTDPETARPPSPNAPAAIVHRHSRESGDAPVEPPPPLIPPALMESLAALDLTSADGCAGLQTFLAEIERRAPGALLQQAAEVQLRRLGCGGITWSG